MKTVVSLMSNVDRCSRREVGKVAIFSTLALFALVSLNSVAIAEESPRFEEKVLPILKAKCTRCHGAKVKKAELDLSSAVGIFRGSESGAIVEVGKPDESLIYEKVHGKEMPPKGEKGRLTKDEVSLIHHWITTGAKSEKTSGSDLVRLSQHDVLPILRLRCLYCHNEENMEGELSLESKASILKGGESGPAIVLGNPGKSLLIKKVHSGDMPPKRRLREASVKPITTAETATIAQWIKEGAREAIVEPDVATIELDPLVSSEDRQFWSFQPPREIVPPKVNEPALVNNPIDAFVIRRLEEQKLALSGPADKLTLLRRASFDLTGLPPEPEEVEAFLADKTIGAYKRLIDRLLDSPRYGERWARYWLDLAGYADSEGKQGDPIRPYAWRYRDYVIRAFNDDKPYDRFLLEQIAGDDLADYQNKKTISQEVMDNLVATGFLRMAPDATGDPPANFTEDRVAVIADEMDIFGSAVLGLTFKCARCHSHKFDPIPHRDYYRLVAVFKGAYDEYNWQPSFLTRKKNAVPEKSHRLLSMVTEEEQDKTETHNSPIQKQVDHLQQGLDKKAEVLKKKHTEKALALVPDQLRDDARRMLATPPDERDATLQCLAKKYEESLKFDAKKLIKLDSSFKKEFDQATKSITALQEQKWYPPAIRGLTDRGQPSLTYVSRRGEHMNFGRLVGPGVPSVLTDGKSPFEIKPPWLGAASTGRRLALARWLVQPEHPLTARVMVNRIWKHHFGRGIVATLDNFGKVGARPTHPELLDWLARQFIEKGWSIKEMHRLMMTSATYQQRSRANLDDQEIDPDNQWLAHMPLQRMDAESLRDTIMLISGRLCETRYGRPDPVKVRKDGLIIGKQTANGYRRSIYLQQKRTEPSTLLTTFDLPTPNPNCVQRAESTVALQALHLSNDTLIRQLAKDFALRVKREVGADLQQQVERVYLLALSRLPTSEEREIGIAALKQLKSTIERPQQVESSSSTTDNPSANIDQEALAIYCHTIFNSSAFLYVD